jgi:hypothetical protein
MSSATEPRLWKPKRFASAVSGIIVAAYSLLVFIAANRISV